MTSKAASFSPSETNPGATTAILLRRNPVSRPQLREALSLLLEAHEYAEELGQDPWTFAVELEVLRAAKLSNSDIRWLCTVGYVHHAYETTDVEDEARTFRQSGAPAFVDRTCFIATTSGIAVARDTCGGTHPVIPFPDPPRIDSGRVETATFQPKWDDQRRQIRVGDRVVKEFKLPAPNQETILTAFEEEGWPPRIDDPLPPVSDLDPRRRLHDTIQALNRKQRQDLLRFMGDGSGEGIRWELRTSQAPSHSGETGSLIPRRAAGAEGHMARTASHHQTSHTANLG
ncbi:MAG TPA: hypothetical protein VGG64_00720 [Pirellulales bacterium]|jgi:hypothetical protein